MPVKKAGLGLLDPMTSVEEKDLTFWRTSTKLIRAVTSQGTLSISDHLIVLREEKRGGQKRRDDTNVSKLKELVNYLEAYYCRLIISAKKTGSWMNVRGIVVSGIVLAAM